MRQASAIDATIFAPAKVNLSLHVVGMRDTYHLLDGLTAFVDIGDDLTISQGPEASGDQVTVSGPFATGLDPLSNSVLLAIEQFRQHSSGQIIPPLQILLHKNLPIAAGLGGGTADAAAVLRHLIKIYGAPNDLPNLCAAIGADTHVCLISRSSHVSGIGEIVRPILNFPEFHLVLVNPGIAVSTAEIFEQTTASSDPVNPPLLLSLSTVADLAAHLSQSRNDLAAAACRLNGVIGNILEMIDSTPGCLLARMSGSGATCFGLYANRIDAQTAANKIAVQQPTWWVKPATKFEQETQ
jgi:4-diphosphocytidyl-2-C-methyl-D-erythritol kinase